MKVTVLFLFVLFCEFAIGQSVSKIMKRLPDTGQTTSYTSTPGEDADFNWNVPAYIFNGNGTVTDSITGLEWQQTDGGEMTVESAITYCDTLTLGGFTDWRLPNSHELFSILHHDKANPAINTSYFTLTDAEYWWSSQRQANDNTKVWCTNAGGGVGNHPKAETISAGGTKKFHVRAVRDVVVPQTIPAHFIDNGDGTVKDMLTNLIWLAMPATDSMTWESALVFADSLTAAGHSDWRMPNIKELQSINDESKINPSINQTFFTGVKVAQFWSSTTLPNQTAKAWYLDTHFGITTYANKTAKLLLLCVRGDGSSTTGILEDNFQHEGFNVFPNPSNGEVYMRLNQKSDKVQIADVNGNIVFQTFATSLNINYQPQSAGIYVVTVFQGKNVLQKRIAVVNGQ